MKTTSELILLFSTLLLMISFTACDGNNKEGEKNSIENFTDKTAHKVVDQINTPIDKAKEIKGLVDQQTKDTKTIIKQIE